MCIRDSSSLRSLAAPFALPFRSYELISRSIPANIQSPSPLPLSNISINAWKRISTLRCCSIHDCRSFGQRSNPVRDSPRSPRNIESLESNILSGRERNSFPVLLSIFPCVAFVDIDREEKEKEIFSKKCIEYRFSFAWGKKIENLSKSLDLNRRLSWVHLGKTGEKKNRKFEWYVYRPLFFASRSKERR